MDSFLVYNTILAFTWSFVVALFATPSIIQLAYKKKILDEPNHRTVHIKLTPRLGGLAIFAGLLSSVTIFGDFSDGYALQYVLASTTLMFFIGLKDDILPVSAFKKFFVQLLAAGIVIIIGDLRITNLHGLAGIYELNLQTSYLISLVTIVGLTNAINLIDGLDGLAGVLIIIICSAFTFFFLKTGSSSAIISVCLTGGVLGFLRYNIVKAKIFMGDTGSLISGFLISILVIQFIEYSDLDNSPALALSIVAIPVFDTLRVMTIRVLNGISPFAPDKNHLHHILLGFGLTPVKVLAVLGVANVSLIVFVNHFLDLEINFLIGGFLILGVIVSIFLQLGKVYLVKRGY